MSDTRVTPALQLTLKQPFSSCLHAGAAHWLPHCVKPKSPVLAAGRSHRATRWLPHSVLEADRQQLLRNFQKRKAEGGVDAFGDLDQGVHPHWVQVRGGYGRGVCGGRGTVVVGVGLGGWALVLRVACRSLPCLGIACTAGLQLPIWSRLLCSRSAPASPSCCPPPLHLSRPPAQPLTALQPPLTPASPTA